MKKIIIALTVMMLALAGYFSLACAENTLVKTYSFNKKKAPKEWSARKTFKVADNRRLGLFNNRNKRYPSKTILTLNDIPADKDIKVKFDMLFIGSWDNEGKLADRFTVSVVDGPTILDLKKFPCTLIENNDTRPVNHNGFVQVGVRDRAYWVKPITLNIPAGDIKDNSLDLEFKGYLTGRKTEFWAIDNVKIVIKQ